MARPTIPEAALEQFRVAAGQFAFVPTSPASRLLPLKREIEALRTKGASYRTITDLLNQCGIRVSDTCVARFCKNELGCQPARGSRRRPQPAPKAASKANSGAATPTTLLVPTPKPVDAAPASTVDDFLNSTPSPNSPPVGPRIARIQFANPDDP